MAIKSTSNKQSFKDREVARIKKSLPLFCCICKRQVKSISELDAMHLLPKSTFPEYYTEEWNIKGGCKGVGNCHDLYDNDLKFRQQQIHLYKIVKKHDEKAAYRYFQLEQS